MWIDEGAPRGGISTRTDPWQAGIGGLADVGVVVLDRDGQLDSSNERARQLLNGETPLVLSENLKEIERSLAAVTGGDVGRDAEVGVDLPGVSIVVRSYCVGRADSQRRVLMLWDAGSRAAAEVVLQQASRYRTFAFLSRDWVHDFKGILHVIRINHAILARIIQQAGAAGAAVGARRLEAIPREVERLDRSLEILLNAKVSEQESTFDVGAMCERVVRMASARAARQRVEVVLDLADGAKEIVGLEDQIQGAVLNLIVNALEAMSEQGHLVVRAEGGDPVRLRICDDGSGFRPELQSQMWKPSASNGSRGLGIGLHVARSIIEAHGGHIDWKPNASGGTCFEIDLPSAASAGSGHGSRTHRR